MTLAIRWPHDLAKTAVAGPMTLATDSSAVRTLLWGHLTSGAQKEVDALQLGTLARYAQRIGKVFASPTTWAWLVRERGWRRRDSAHIPAKTAVGVRACRRNELWQIAATIIQAPRRHQGVPPFCDRQLLATDPGLDRR